MVLSVENVVEGIMPDDEKMTVDERRKVLRKIQKRYQGASRQEKGQLLDEMERLLGMHRVAIGRLLNSDLARKPRVRQRGRTYGIEVQRALMVIAESLDYLCAERLKPNLVWMAEHLEAHGELETTPDLLEKLERISVSTVRSLLDRANQDQPRLPRKGPQEANRFRRHVPTRRIPWHEQEPGHFEVDLVHHCGISPSGQYVHTLQMIDVATGWSERAATLGRSFLVIEDGFRRILARLPFRVLEIHPDNDTAFFNYHLDRFWREKVKGVELSRSRPFRKNDNSFVEQKNSSLVRAYLGFDRLDTVEQTNLLNQLYEKMWIYYNLFQPVMRLEEKLITPLGDGRSRVKRRYDTARSPFDRLCATGQLDPTVRKKLDQLRRDTNPRQLRREIGRMLDRLQTLPAAREGQTEDVYVTLFQKSRKGAKGENPSTTLSFGRTIPVP
jgi:hypothetical protein